MLFSSVVEFYDNIVVRQSNSEQNNSTGLLIPVAKLDNCNLLTQKQLLVCLICYTRTKVNYEVSLEFQILISFFTLVDVSN